MTLDEAIKHCEEKADELNKEVLNQANLCNAREMADCQECARDHEQLAEWLKELKALKENPQGVEACSQCEFSCNQGWEMPCKECMHAYDDRFLRADIKGGAEWQKQ